MRIVTAGATHIGLVREVNEDSYLAYEGIALVADGMGGHAAGDIASSLTIGAFEGLATRRHVAPHDVLEAIARANQAIVTEASRRSDRARMGTTVTGLAIVEQAGLPHWLVFNVGDSRVYRLIGTELVQLTVDHSEVAELVAAGRINNDQARVHPLRNVVTRSLGTVPAPDVETWLVPIQAGDLFLLCSDGLTNELLDDEIAEVISGSSTLASATSALIDAALAAGGHDNITVVLVAADGGITTSDRRPATAFSTLPRTGTDTGA